MYAGTTHRKKKHLQSPLLSSWPPRLLFRPAESELSRSLPTTHIESACLVWCCLFQSHHDIQIESGHLGGVLTNASSNSAPAVSRYLPFALCQSSRARPPSLLKVLRPTQQFITNKSKKIKNKILSHVSINLLIPQWPQPPRAPPFSWRGSQSPAFI